MGTVAEGVQFTDGRICLNWCLSSRNKGMGHAGLAIYDNILDCVKIHGHDGSTLVRWVE